MSTSANCFLVTVERVGAGWSTSVLQNWTFRRVETWVLHVVSVVSSELFVCPALLPKSADVLSDLTGKHKVGQDSVRFYEQVIGLVWL